MIRLWFDDVSNRNFFYSFMDFNKETYGEILHNDTPLLAPSNMAIYYPEREQFYIMKKTRVEYEEILLTSRRMLQTLILNGKNEGITLVNWNDFWSRRSIVMKLPFEMSYEILLEDTQITKKDEGIDYVFNYLILMPNNDVNGKMSCYLVNAEQGQSMKITLDKTKERGNNQYLLDRMDDIFNKSSFPVYVGTKKLGLRIFNQNAFLPIEDVTVYYNQSINIIQPFVTDGKVDSGEVERYVNNFFSNPVAKYVVKEDQVWTYRDEKTVVRYNINGVVEYSDLNNKRDNVGVSLVDAYKIANRFLQGDPNLQWQEYYLTDYRLTDEDIVFYYHYKFNDFDFVLSDDFKAELNMEAPIEVIVSEGKVAYYKRWVLDKQVNMFDYQEFDLDYKNTLDYFFDTYSDFGHSIDNMSLAYYIEGIEKDARLSWVIESDRKYILNLKR